VPKKKPSKEKNIAVGMWVRHKKYGDQMEIIRISSGVVNLWNEQKTYGLICKLSELHNIFII
jgi:hypothetical protein